MDQKMEVGKAPFQTLAVSPRAALLHDYNIITWLFIESHILTYLCAKVQLIKRHNMAHSVYAYSSM